MNIINTEKAALALGPYSQAVEHNGVIYTAGQIAINPITNEIDAVTIKGQTHQVCQNLLAVLQEAGSNLAKVMKTTCYLADMADFSAFNEVYGVYFTGKPARSCVAVKTLPKNVLVEIDTIAVK